MVSTIRALAATRVGESSGGVAPVDERGVETPPVVPLGPRVRAMPATHPALVEPTRGVQLRAQAISAPPTVAAVSDDHPELTSSVMNRFLGLARHEVEAASERALNDDETRRLRILLGANARLNPKTVPPNFDDQRLLQRMLNVTLGAALSPPLEVDGNIGGATRNALQLYRRTRGLPATTSGALVDRAMLERMGREAMQARATPSSRVPRPGAEASPAERSVAEMLDLLSREDPVRYGALLRSVGVTSTRPVTEVELRRVIAAGAALNLRFDVDTATRLQLSQPGFAEPLPWNYEAARVVAAFISGEMSPNRGIAGLGTYRSWARRAEHAGLVLPRILEIDALVESSYNPRLVSSARARGLHQLTNDVTDRYGGLDPFDPVLNIGMARRELARVYDEQLRRLRLIDDSYARRYPDEASFPRRDTERNDGSIWRMAWAANNAGPRRLLRYQGVPPFDETQRHVMFMAWYNATLPGDGAVPPVGFAPPIPQGPRGPEDYGVKSVTKEF